MDQFVQYLSLFTFIGSAISFSIGLFKWIDQRNREQDQKRYEAFHKMVCLASGVDETGRGIKMVQQIAAIYQLQAYKQYAFASIPVLKLMQCESIYQNHTDKFIKNALSETIDALSK